MAKPVLILFGTQSGNTEDLAAQLAVLGQAHGLSSTIKGMDEIGLGEIATSERVLLLCSTWGEGDMPENAEDLWDIAQTDAAPRMEGMHFSICALGDTSYEFYCQSGKDWDDRFEQLGATRVHARQDCDVDYDDEFAAWAASALPAIAAVGEEAEQAAAPEPVAAAAPGEAAAAVETGDSSAELDALMAQPARDLLILYGSQSGNGEDLAFRTQAKAAAFGLTCVVADMQGFDPATLASTTRLIVICSTWGEGDMPDSAQDLYDACQAPGAPSLSMTHFCVCALGDTSYELYCESGKQWDVLLEKMGGTRVQDRVDCDVDFDPAYEAWVDGALAAVAAVDSDATFHPELASAFIEMMSGAEGAGVIEDPDSVTITRPAIDVRITVFRYDPLAGESGWDSYDCSIPAHYSVLGALQMLKRKRDPTLTYRGTGPLSGVMVNGRLVRADRTRLLDLTANGSRPELKIEPLPGHAVIRDLVVGTEAYDDHRASTKPWMRPATRDGSKLPAGGAIGAMSSEAATRLHVLGDFDSQHLVHACSDSVPYAPDYIGPAAVIHLWKRVNDPRTSEEARADCYDTLQGDTGAWSETDIAGISRQGAAGRRTADLFWDIRADLLRRYKFEGRSGRHVKWFGRTVKQSGTLNETVLAAQTMGPIGMLANIPQVIRMALGFTRTGGPMVRDMQGWLAPGKMPPIINARVEDHHEVVAIYNELDGRF